MEEKFFQLLTLFIDISLKPYISRQPIHDINEKENCQPSSKVKQITILIFQKYIIYIINRINQTKVDENWIYRWHTK